MPSGTVMRLKYGAPTESGRSFSASASSGNTVPSSTTKANPANSTLLARKAPSRDTGESICPGRPQPVAAPADQAEGHRDDEHEER